MKHLKKTIITASILLLSYSWYAFGSLINDRVEYYAYSYRITDENQKKFLQRIAQSKNVKDFLKSNEDIIKRASPNLLEAAYWLAVDQKKSDLAEELKSIIGY